MRKIYLIFIFLLFALQLLAQENIIRPYVLVVNSEGGISEATINEISYILRQKLKIAFQGQTNIKIHDTESWREAEFALLSLDKAKRATYGIKETQDVIIPNDANAVIICEIKSEKGIIGSVYFEGYCIQNNGVQNRILNMESFFIAEAYEYSTEKEFKIMDIEYLANRTKIVKEIYEEGWSKNNLNKFIISATEEGCLIKEKVVVPVPDSLDVINRTVIQGERTVYDFDYTKVDEFIMEDNSTLTIKDVTQWTLNAGKVIIGKDCKIIANGVDVVINANIIENVENVSIDISGSCIDENGSVMLNGVFKEGNSLFKVNKSTIVCSVPSYLQMLPVVERDSIITTMTLAKINLLQNDIIKIADKKLPEIERNDAISSAVKHFISETSIMEVSSLIGNVERRDTPSVRQYFGRLKDLEYDAVKITFPSTKVTSIQYLGNNKYRVTGNFCQSFQGLLSGKIAYYDYTIKTLDIHFNEINLGRDGIKRTILIEDIFVDRTSKTGCKNE